MLASPPRRFRSLAGSIACVLGAGLTSSCCFFSEFGEGWDRMLAYGFELMYASWYPWSPDGQSLLFANPYAPDSGLHLLHLDGSAPEVLARGSFLTPRWSPDGTTIVFASEDPHDIGPTSGLWIMSADGSDRCQLATAFGFAWFTPAWSPDGEWIAYATDTIELVLHDGSARRSLGPGYLPVWSPDGTRIASVIPDEDSKAVRLWIQVMPVDGSRTARLTRGMTPSWSPDGTSIVFWDFEDEGANSAVFVVGADGSNRRRLCDGGFPRWSPIADRILVQRFDDTLVTIGSDGSDEQIVARNARFGRWSPDGQWIAFQWWSDVYVVRSDGSDRRLLGRAEALQTDDP